MTEKYTINWQTFSDHLKLIFKDLYQVGPLPGQCDTDSVGKVKSVIYKAEVTRLDSNETQKYIGLTGGTFKKHWYGHRNDIWSFDKDNRHTAPPSVGM